MRPRGNAARGAGAPCVIDRRGGAARRRRGEATAASLVAALAFAAVAAAPADAAEPPRLEPPDVRLAGRFEAVPSREVYAAIGEQAELVISLDPELRDETVTIHLDGLSPLEALDDLAKLAGHFVVPLGPRAAKIVQDTPQNRRLHESLGIRSFVLRHAETAEVMTALRTLIDVRRLVPTATPPRVTVRDTYPKLAVAARIVELLDREPWEIRLQVELLPADPPLLAELAEAGAEVSAERAVALRRRAGRAYAAGLVGLIGTREAQWKTFHSGDGAAAEAAADESSRLVSLTVRGWLAPDDERLGLELDLTVLAPGKPRLDSLRQTSTFRLGPGSSLALPILLPGGGADEDAALLLITPTVVSRGELSPQPFETFLVGTESNVVDAPRSGGGGS